MIINFVFLNRTDQSFNWREQRTVLTAISWTFIIPDSQFHDLKQVQVHLLSPAPQTIETELHTSPQKPLKHVQNTIPQSSKQ